MEQKLITFKYKLEHDMIDNALLPVSETKQYDLDKCYLEVKSKIEEFILDQFNFPQIPKPQITTSYEIRYEYFVTNATDKVGNYIEKKVDKEREIVKLYQEISRSLTLLSRGEFTYFLECLYFNKKESVVIDKLETTRYYFNPIKYSCIVKLAKAWGVAKLKEET